VKTAHIRNKEIDTSNIKYLVVQGDAIDVIRFVLQKTYEGVDLSAAVFHAKYRLPSGNGDIEALSVTPSEGGDLLYADWDVSGWPTSEKGAMQVQIQASLDGKVWQTKEASLYVDGSINLEDLGEFSPTGLTQYLGVFQTVLADAEAARDAALASKQKAALWADASEDVKVEENPDKYSAKHHALKSEASAGAAHDSEIAAAGSATAASNSKDAAALSEGKAKDWAEKAEDAEVEPGQFSSLHHAKKAEASAISAQAADAAANNQVDIDGTLYQFSWIVKGMHIGLSFTEVI
jgi:hypothetical protein